MSEEGELYAGIISKLDELLEFLRDKEENDSINESIRREDTIYFRFLLSTMALLATLLFGLHQLLDTETFNKILPFIAILIILLFIFSFIRFIGTVIESRLLRYISIHGLIMLAFVVYPVSLPIISNPSSINVYYFIFYVFIFMWALLPTIDKELVDKFISGTEKYRNIRPRAGLVTLYGGLVFFPFIAYWIFYFFIKNQIDTERSVILLGAIFYCFYLFYDSWRLMHGKRASFPFFLDYFKNNLLKVRRKA